MKNWMRKTIALLLALVLVTGAVAFAEKETVSDAFRLPSVSEKPAEKDEPAQEPADEPVEDEPVVDEPVEDEPVVDEPVEDEPVEDEPTEGEIPAEGEELEGEEATDEEQTEVETEGPAIIGKATVTLSDAGSRLNVRAGASKSSDVLGSLENGAVVSVLANEGEWLKIVYGEGAGYVKASLTTMGAVEEEPVEEEPVEETPVEEPVEEEPVEETPVEEIPAEEEPIEEEPVEEEPVEEEPAVEYLTDENGELILDENGNPIPVEPVEEIPADEIVVDEPIVEYLLDAEGNPVLDLNGNPIPAGEYVTDENGNLVFDENGAPIPVATEEEPAVEEVVDETVPAEVYITCDAGSEVFVGDIITFTAHLTNCGENPKLQWQYTDDGANWYDIEGANELTYSIVLSVENASCEWRVNVDVEEAPVEEPVEEPVEDAVSE